MKKIIILSIKFYTMKIALICLLFVATIGLVHGQSPRKFLDKNFKETDQASAVYYRTVDKQLHKFLIRDYYISGVLQSEIVSADRILDDKRTGDAKFYYENGNKKHEGRFEDGKSIGLHKYYYENGNPHEELFFGPSDETFYRQVWDDTGKPMLVDGTGKYAEKTPTSNTLMNFEIRNGKLYSSYQVSSSSDTIYLFGVQQPVYRDGLPGMVRAVRAELIYPHKARRNHTEGKVFVMFIVDKEGRATDVSIVKGLSDECDAEALRVVKTLNDWTPGMLDGKPVKVKYVLPINFKI